jgi:hypothetical protein
MFSDSALFLMSHLRTVSHATAQQGLTLVHFSARREHHSWYTLCGCRVPVIRTAQIEMSSGLRSGRPLLG